MEQLHNNVLQSKSMKTSSHYVIICSTQNHARVQESEEISMCTGQGVQSLSVNTVCHPQMQVKVLSPKEAVCERDIKMAHSSLA